MDPEAPRGVGGHCGRAHRALLGWSPRRATPEALSVLAGVIRHATLQRIVVLASTRKRLVLRNDQGADLGEIDDDVVTVAKGTHKGLTFRQIELEFGDGHSPTEPTGYVVDAVVRRSARRVPTLSTCRSSPSPSGWTAPLRRIRRSARPAGPRRRRRPAQHRQRLRATARSRLPVATGAGDPPARAVHQARVATRRLRSDLKTFSPLPRPGVAAPHHGRAQVARVIAWGRSVTPMSWRSASSVRGTWDCACAWPPSAATSARKLAEAINGNRYMHLLDGCTPDPTPLRSTWTSDPDEIGSHAPTRRSRP